MSEDRVPMAPTHRRDRAQMALLVDGTAKLGGDWWMVIRHEGQIAVLLGAPRGRSWETVLGRLNLCGYWPTLEALCGYVDASVAA